MTGIVLFYKSLATPLMESKSPISIMFPEAENSLIYSIDARRADHF